ncbi:YtxH domain-containing protein [Lentibacillus lipolyticus]|nr:YtxH domain-containing protein [Lentibacillus lipolyticus]
MENEVVKEFNGKEFVLGSIIGAIGGALAALFLAPKSGNELRSDLNSGTVELKHRASDWKNKAYSKGSEWKDSAIDKGSEWKEKAADSTTRLAQKAQKLTPAQEKEMDSDVRTESAATADIAEHK